MSESPDQSLDAAAQRYLETNIAQRERTLAGEDPGEAPGAGPPETELPSGASAPLEALDPAPEEGAPEAPDGELVEPVAEGEGGDPQDPGVYDFDPALRFRIPTADGHEEVTLEDLRAGSLRQADYTRKTMELSEQRKTAAHEVAAMQAVSAQLGQVTTELEGHLARYRPDPAELAALERNDPGQYALLKMQEQERAAQLTEAKRVKAQTDAALKAREVPIERQRLAELLPAAFGGDKFNAAYVELGDWATSEAGGIPQELWDEMRGHRLIANVWKAREYDRLASKAPQLREKIRTLPTRSVRPGAPRDPGETTGRQERAAKERLEKTGTVQDAANFWLARRNAQQERR